MCSLTAEPSLWPLFSSMEPTFPKEGGELILLVVPGNSRKTGANEERKGKTKVLSNPCLASEPIESRL